MYRKPSTVTYALIFADCFERCAASQQNNNKKIYSYLSIVAVYYDYYQRNNHFFFRFFSRYRTHKLSYLCSLSRSSKRLGWQACIKNIITKWAGWDTNRLRSSTGIEGCYYVVATLQACIYCFCYWTYKGGCKIYNLDKP